MKRKGFTNLLLLTTVCLAGSFSQTMAQNHAAIDQTFVPAQPSSNVYATDVQPDGKIIITGFFNRVGNTSRNRIARLNQDGTLDATFNPGSGTNQLIEKVLVQQNGKVIVAGQINSISGVNRGGIARLDASGNLEANYAAGSGFSPARILSMALQPDGKLLVGGSFTGYSGTAAVGYCRLDTNGAIDPTFTLPVANQGQITAMAVQPDGMILIAGTLPYTFGQSPRTNILRLLPDGTIDQNFGGMPNFSNSPLTIGLQSTGKIIVGGLFDRVGSTTVNYLVRLNADGSLDNTFNAGTAMNANVREVLIQADDKILAVGEFTTVNGTPSRYIVRLNADGSLDQTFNVGTGLGAMGRTIDFDRDGKIIVTGDFRDVNGTSTQRYVSRLIGDRTLVSTPSLVHESSALTLYPNPAQHIVRVASRHASISDYRMTNAQGQTVKSGQLNLAQDELDISNLPNGVYMIRFSDGTTKRVTKN